MASREAQAAGRDYATNVKNASIWGQLGEWAVNTATKWVDDKLSQPSAPPAPRGTGSSGSLFGTALTGAGGCPRGYVLVAGNCVNPLALPPGGTPAVVPQSGTTLSAGGGAVMGAFGLPARQPMVETQTVRRCGPRMVLGADNLCYPKAILGRRSSYRKWKQPPRPALSSSDVKTIRKADRLVEKVKGLNKDLGLKVPTKRRR